MMENVLPELAAEITGALAGETNTMLSRRDKTLLAIGAIVACASLWWLSALIDVPTYPGYSISILAQPSAFNAAVMTAIGFAVCTLLGTLVARSVRHDAGLWCATIALVALSSRGGPVRFVLMSAAGPTIFLRLAAEIVFFAACFVLGGLVQRGCVAMGLLARESDFDKLDPTAEPIHRKLLATFTGVAIAALIILILCQSDRKLQVTLIVGFASFAGALGAYYLVPVGPVRWFVAIPLVCGVIGYLATYFSDPSGWIIGEPRGMLRALARPLPLDYAGAGGAGAILGYWLGRWWQFKNEAELAMEQSGDNNRPIPPRLKH